VKDLVALVAGRQQASGRLPGLGRVILPELLRNDLVQSDVKPRVDLVGADDGDLFVCFERLCELRMLRLDEQVAFVAILRIEQGEVESPKRAALRRGCESAAGRVIRRWTDQPLWRSAAASLSQSRKSITRAMAESLRAAA